MTCTLVLTDGHAQEPVSTQALTLAAAGGFTSQGQQSIMNPGPEPEPPHLQTTPPVFSDHSQVTGVCQIFQTSPAKVLEYLAAGQQGPGQTQSIPHPASLFPGSLFASLHHKICFNPNITSAGALVVTVGVCSGGDLESPGTRPCWALTRHALPSCCGSPT